MEDWKMKADPELLVRQYADMVYRIALLHTKRKEDAEDVFQEVFLRLMKYIDGIEDEDHLRFWLVRVTVNCCNSLFESGWKKHVTTFEVLPEDTDTGGLEEKADHTVYDGVRGLPEKYRTVIHLFYFEGMSIADIAVICRCREGTIKSRLSRGRRMLKKRLQEEGYDDRG